MEVSGGYLFADVLGGGNCFAGVVGNGLTAEVGSGKISRLGYGFRPCEEIGRLLGEEAAAFFLVEKEDSVGRELLALGGGYGCACVFLAQDCGFDSGSLGFADLGVEAAIEEDEEAEVVAEEDVALASPGVGRRAGRVVEPVSSEGEVLAEGGKRGVAGVVVAVESDVGLVAGSCAWAEEWLLRIHKNGDENKSEAGDEQAHVGV